MWGGPNNNFFFKWGDVTPPSYIAVTPMYNIYDYTYRPGAGNLFSAKGHLDIYKIIRGPYRIINLKMCLLYLVKHLINSPLMWWLELLLFVRFVMLAGTDAACFDWGAVNISGGVSWLRKGIVLFFILLPFLRLLIDPSVNQARSQTL